MRASLWVLAILAIAVPSRLLAESSNGVDIRMLAPVKVEERKDIATPQTGNDFSSVSQDWMARQTNLMTNGTEAKLLERLNRGLQSGVSSVVSTPTTSNELSNSQRASADNQGMRFTRINRMEMDFSFDGQLSCDFKGDSIDVDYTKKMYDAIDFKLRHQSRDAKSSILLNYDW